MNTINENEVRLANLQAAAEMRRAELACIRSGVARQVAKVARTMCDWDYGKCRITFWSFRRGELVRVAAPRKSRKSSR